MGSPHQLIPTSLLPLCHIPTLPHFAHLFYSSNRCPKIFTLYIKVPDPNGWRHDIRNPGIPRYSYLPGITRNQYQTGSSQETLKGNSCVAILPFTNFQLRHVAQQLELTRLIGNNRHRVSRHVSTLPRQTRLIAAVVDY